MKSVNGLGHDKDLIQPHCKYIYFTTVDASEIRRAPVEAGSLSHYLRPVFYIPGG